MVIYFLMVSVDIQVSNSFTLQQTRNLVYIFMEVSGDLSLFDFHRQSLRKLPTLFTEGLHSHVHCGCALVDGRLYVVGGFGAFRDVDLKHPIAPRHSICCYNPEMNTWLGFLLCYVQLQ